ncbi:lytic murein transglycosylase [Methylomicrobium sp. Wu6]|uniref:lytic murein transglycosylase n=1 Tax=Methylomicrobium sp. Wu6 TaxID=3107928 RepID=UPI002DD6405E|nr:lytic murein transglycosylase [Methylomicrobium sp. Wu6]MEC4747862.1 lytic murein transglycosylase [Methylomicrobium sp. Wu6]
MTTRILKHFSIAALAVLFAGCASDAHKSREQYSYQGPQAPIAPYPNPGMQPPVAQYPAIPSQPSSYRGYSSTVLAGIYANYPAVRGFIRDMVSKHGFSESYLNGLFSRANRLDSVIRLESPAPSQTPSTPRPGSWTRYRNKFLTEQHIQNGANFWLDNADVIRRASATYGVDPEYIVAIIGVETYFGRNFGKTNIFDSLTTLSFDTYRRSNFFKSELESFLLMAREEGFDPREPEGSWAGAMGYGQFMPSSFRRLAIDFNHDGQRDLWHPHDAIGSVAHYFSKNGWHYNGQVARPGNIARNDDAVIELSTYEGNEYWRIFPNFKVIKRYNNSNKYAMAVHQLAQAIKQRVESSKAVIRSSSAR